MRAVIFSMPDMVPHFFDRRFRVPGQAGPLLAANAPQHEIWSADLILQRKRLRRAIEDVVRTYRPQVVGLSAKSFEYYSACKTAEIVRGLDPSIRLGLGGYHATVNYDLVADSPEGALFDFIFRGEGEATFASTLDRLERQEDLTGIPGLSFRRGDAWLHNPSGEKLDLSRLAPPQRDRRIWKDFGFIGQGLDVFETTRGCTLPCNFCSITQMYGRTFREFSIDYILASIEDAKRQGATFMFLADDNVVLNPLRFMEVLRAIIDHGHNDLLYLVQGSANGIAKHPELAPLMAQAGFKFVFLGIESMSDKNLAQMDADKKAGRDQRFTERAIELLQKAGILIVGGLILGLPNDDVPDIEQNFRRYREKKLAVADQIITPYGKTGQRQELLEGGYVTNASDFRRYNGFWANVQTDHLSPWELEYWRWYYYRKCYSIRGPNDDWKQMSRLNYYFVQYVLTPWRWLRFKLQDPQEAFERYQRRHAKLNDLWGDAYPPLHTPYARGGKIANGPAPGATVTEDIVPLRARA
jgi:radical SAM superfamily enzyme YgiQ (UPF0313 family)